MQRQQNVVPADSSLAELSERIGSLTRRYACSTQAQRLTRVPDALGRLPLLADFCTSASHPTSLPESIGGLIFSASVGVAGRQSLRGECFLSKPKTDRRSDGDREANPYPSEYQAGTDCKADRNPSDVAIRA